MLQLKIPSTEVLDEAHNSFINIKECTLQLEHSLISLSRWESKWKKPFLSNKPKTKIELVDYIRCMTLNSVDPNVYSVLTNDMIKQVSDYIEDSHTATWFKETDQKKSHEVITSEVIYYWMIAAEVPFECQKWHLNRLMTLIRICSIKNEEATKKAKNKGKIPKTSGSHPNRHALNAARRSSLGTNG